MTKNSVVTILPSIIFVIILLHNPSTKWIVQAQTIPPKFDGFVYGDISRFNPKNILIEAFMDPVCPDSRDSWPPLKRVLHNYASHISLIVHPFSLPYHDNSFVSSRAMHIINGIDRSLTYPLLERFFKIQEKFYTEVTFNQSRSEITDDIAKVVASVAGRNHYSAIKYGFKNSDTDQKTRISFKYGCARGVYGAPFFIVNGFILSGGGLAIEYNRWKKIIEPLIGSKKGDKIDHAM